MKKEGHSTTLRDPVTGIACHALATRSRRTSQTWSGNVGDRYSYDEKGQVTGVEHSVSSPATATGPITPDHAYTYDDMGNRETFNVTTAGASATVPARNTNYGTANEKNQYVSIAAVGTPPEGFPIHDRDGNLTDDGNRTYVWDAWNRLREVKDKATSQKIATYHYDGQGRRISKETTAAAVQGAETVLFIYDGWNVIQEWSSATVDKAYLVWGNDLSGSQQGAGGVGGLLMRQVTGGQTLYYHYDANGNPARLTNAANSTGTYRYDAFGNVRTAAGSLVDQVGENPWQFSTKYHDPETGFSYYGYRYYDPVTGRWPSRDPIGERGGVNLYDMVGNRIVNTWDLLGLLDPNLGLYDPENGQFGIDPNPEPAGPENCAACHPVQSGSSALSDNWWASFAEAVGLTVEWALGFSPEYQTFGHETQQARDMSDARRVNEAREFFEKKNAGKACSDLAEVRNYKGSFGLTDLLWHAGLDPTEQFVGSYRIDIYDNGHALETRGTCDVTFSLKNTTSFKSLSYGIGPDWGRHWSGQGLPGSNSTQYFTWREKWCPTTGKLTKYWE